MFFTSFTRSGGLDSNNRLSAHTSFLFNRKSSFDDCIFRLVRSIAFFSHYSTFSDLRLFSVHNVWMYVRTSPFPILLLLLLLLLILLVGDEDDVTQISPPFLFLLCLGDCCFLTDEWLNRTAEFEARRVSLPFLSLRLKNRTMCYTASIRRPNCSLSHPTSPFYQGLSRVEWWCVVSSSSSSSSLPLSRDHFVLDRSWSWQIPEEIFALFILYAGGSYLFLSFFVFGLFFFRSISLTGKMPF